MVESANVIGTRSVSAFLWPCQKANLNGCTEKYLFRVYLDSFASETSTRFFSVILVNPDFIGNLSRAGDHGSEDEKVEWCDARAIHFLALRTELSRHLPKRFFSGKSATRGYANAGHDVGRGSTPPLRCKPIAVRAKMFRIARAWRSYPRPGIAHSLMFRVMIR